MKFGLSPASAGLVGGMSGGIVQAYATMGRCFEYYPLEYITTFNPLVRRFLYLHEDCGDYPSQASRCRNKAPVDMGCLC
jgi:hypothetical protein